MAARDMNPYFVRRFCVLRVKMKGISIMVTRLILFLLVALGGAGLTLQAAWNARLRTSTTSPVLTAMISVLVTLLSLALVWASGATERGSLPPFNSLPNWAWFGGVFAAFYLVASLIAIPKLGAAVVFSLVIAGQMFAALILDSTGAFEVVQIPISLSRGLGTALLLLGVILIQTQ
ncbi:MAG TPA: DMT family transporter [Roseiflexaceae bacterium]|nr:DMT family transporter [Roseiflexaceae bacterium]